MSTSKPLWWRPWRRVPRTALAAEIVLVALLGGWLGMLAGGHQEASIGPVQAEMSIVPSTVGDTVVSLPPLGRLNVDTHDGPWRLRTEVVRINAADARRIFNDPASVNGLAERVSKDMQEAVRELAIKTAAAAVLGAVLLGMLVFRLRLRRALIAGGLAAGVVLAGGGAAMATWNPAAITEPRYDGLLASAPTLVGDARSIVSDFHKYERQLAKIVTNVSRLYDVTSTLPAYTPDESTIRVLHVSDIHLNPAAWEIIRSVAEQFDVDMIVDTGDISDHGTAAESRFLDPIATLGVPYVFIRGNHDSMITQRAVAAEPNARVLDGNTAEVAGLRLLGVGDPRFTPDKDTRGEQAPESVLSVAVELAVTAREKQPDVVLVHDPAMAPALDGTTPLVLAGHYHRREQHELEQGTVLFQQGSTGASGLRGLEHEKPTPVRCSVLYFDRETRRLQAWDDITLGGLGVTSARIKRQIYEPSAPGDIPAAPAPSFGETTTPTAPAPGARTRAP